MSSEWQAATAVLLETCSEESNKNVDSGMIHFIPFLFRGQLETALTPRRGATPLTREQQKHLLLDWWHAHRLMHAAGLSIDTYHDASEERPSLYHLVLAIVRDQTLEPEVIEQNLVSPAVLSRARLPGRVTEFLAAAKAGRAALRVSSTAAFGVLLNYRRQFREFSSAGKYQPNNLGLKLLLECSEPLTPENVFSKELPEATPLQFREAISRTDARYLFRDLSSLKDGFEIPSLYQIHQGALTNNRSWFSFLSVIHSIIDRETDAEHRRRSAAGFLQLADELIKRNVSEHNRRLKDQRPVQVDKDQRPVQLDHVVRFYRRPDLDATIHFSRDLLFVTPSNIERTTALANLEAKIRIAVWRQLSSDRVQPQGDRR